MTPQLLGCDFSSAPTVRKPVTVAVGELGGATVGAVRAVRAVRLEQVLSFSSLDAWQQWLGAQAHWVGAFDFPFGLPRELLRTWGWVDGWEQGIRAYAALERVELRQRFKDFCAARPAGAKFAHRVTDGPAGASPSMKWVNPPVAWMMHAGVPRLLAVGARFPGLGGPAGARRVALEGYPGLLAREMIGRRSYKADDRARQTPERAAARAEMLDRLQAQGSARLGLRLVLDEASRTRLIGDPGGDQLDAVLCLMQAAWAQERAGSPGPGYGLPQEMDPLEGWIVGADALS